MSALLGNPERDVHEDLLSESSVTHGDLVKRAERWLRDRIRCAVVLTGRGADGEIPDAIGWHYDGKAWLIECKASRADYLADRAKPFRVTPDQGMGLLRFFMAPPDIVQPDEVPPFWGLLWAYPTFVKVKRRAKCVPWHNTRGENHLLLTEVARYQLYGMKYPQLPKAADEQLRGS